MANDPFKPTDEEALAALAGEDAGNLGNDIIKRWDPSNLLRVVSTRAGKGESLDEATRRRYERKLGADLSGVRIYSGEFAEEVAKAHRADALTIGNTGMIMMGGSPGKGRDSRSGEALLAHELTHVAQGQRGVHRKGSFGESAPLAHELSESEAESVEAEVMNGSEPGANEQDAAEAQKQLLEMVTVRVFDMFAEDHRDWMIRNGDDVWRP